MSKRSKSSQNWLERQKRDPYNREAKAFVLASRAYFKLEQLDRSFKLLSQVKLALELGAAPGGWTSYIEKKISKHGKLIAVDPLEVKGGPKTVHIKGCVGTGEIDLEIERILNGYLLDIVLSDMAPNISGVKVVDQAKSIELANLALSIGSRWLKEGGALVVKCFQSPDLGEFVEQLKRSFATVRLVKPHASRSQSSELYVVAKNLVEKSAGQVE